MDTEKAFHADASFQNQPYWMSCHSCRATQKKQYVLKCIFSFVMFGLLAMNTYQYIHVSPTGLSSLQLEQHYAASVEAHGHRNSSLGVEAPPTTDDTQWYFIAYTENGCTGETTSEQGTTPIVECQPLNQAYNSTSVTTLDDSLKIRFYEEDECGGQSTAITAPPTCQNFLPPNSYRVLTKPINCQLGLI